MPARFFDVGMRVQANPRMVGFEAREGHLVPDHTWSQPHLSTLTPAQVRSHVLRTQGVLRKAGAPMPFKLPRPPYGDVNPAVDAQLTRLGYHHVNWDVVAVDWDVATTSVEIRGSDREGIQARPCHPHARRSGRLCQRAGGRARAAPGHRPRPPTWVLLQLDRLGTVVPATLPEDHASIPEILGGWYLRWKFQGHL